MRLVRQCNARSVTVVTSILMHIKRRKDKFKVDLVTSMHIERRKNKFKVGNDHFFSQCWNPNVGVNVGVGVGVGKNVGFHWTRLQ